MGGNDAVYGIWEFMPADFRAIWYPGVTNANVLSEEPVAGIKSRPITCGPLGVFLALLNIDHIDFWSLDVEGAELHVLRGIDLERVTVDVIVSRAGWGGTRQRIEQCAKYLTARGYEIDSPDDPSSVSPL